MITSKQILRRGIGMLVASMLMAATPDAFAVKKEIRIGAGVKSIFGLGMWGPLPVPVTVNVDLDIGRLVRIHGGFTHRVFEHINRWSVGGGVAFTPVGRRAPRRGGFQLKVPVIGEFGMLIGDAEADDGYYDEVKWIIIGPSTGLDFTWWSRAQVGFNLGLRMGCMFHIDVGSHYPDGYSRTHGIATFELGLLLGVAF